MVVNGYQQRRETRQSDDERMDDCCLKTLYILKQESDRKKLEYIQCFAQNTIISETCAIDTEGILRFLMDIEQMTWRQICLIEGFNRRERKEIEIQGIQISGVNGRLRFSEIIKLENLDYLHPSPNRYRQTESGMLVTSDIEILPLVPELATLMDLKSIPIDEIGSAFGTGMVKETRTY